MSGPEPLNSPQTESSNANAVDVAQETSSTHDVVAEHSPPQGYDRSSVSPSSGGYNAQSNAASIAGATGQITLFSSDGVEVIFANVISEKVHDEHIDIQSLSIEGLSAGEFEVIDISNTNEGVKVQLSVNNKDWINTSNDNNTVRAKLRENIPPDVVYPDRPTHQARPVRVKGSMNLEQGSDDQLLINVSFENDYNQDVEGLEVEDLEIQGLSPGDFEVVETQALMGQGILQVAVRVTNPDWIQQTHGQRHLYEVTGVIQGGFAALQCATASDDDEAKHLCSPEHAENPIGPHGVTAHRVDIPEHLQGFFEHTAYSDEAVEGEGQASEQELKDLRETLAALDAVYSHNPELLAEIPAHLHNIHDIFSDADAPIRLQLLSVIAQGSDLDVTEERRQALVENHERFIASLESQGVFVQSDSPINDLFEGAILGGFSGKNSFSAIVGQVLGGLNPIADIRDIAAASWDIYQGKPGAVAGLGLATIALLPIPGIDTIKHTRRGDDLVQPLVKEVDLHPHAPHGHVEAPEAKFSQTTRSEGQAQGAVFDVNQVRQSARGKGGQAWRSLYRNTNAGKLPRLSGKRKARVEKILSERGFKRDPDSPNKWYHSEPNGSTSIVRIDRPHGGDNDYRGSKELHFHKEVMDEYGNYIRLDDYGRVNADPNRTHIIGRGLPEEP